MPKKKRDTSNWRPQGLDAIASGPVFTPEQADKIVAAIGGIKSDDRAVFLAAVEDRVKVYRLMRQNDDGRPQPADMRAEIDRVHSAQRELLAALAALDERTREWLHAAADRVARKPKGRFLRDAAGWLMRDGAGDIRFNEVVEGIRRLRAWLFIARRGLPASKPGPRSSNPLILLVRALAAIYADRTGQRFTRSYKCSAETFVKTVVGAADPQVGNGKLDTAIRQVAREQATTPRFGKDRT